eukprot:68472_1
MTSLYNKNMSDTKQHTTTTDDPDKLFKLIIDTLNEKEMENENSKINKECMIKLIEENNLNLEELLTEHEREHEEQRCNINICGNALIKLYKFILLLYDIIEKESIYEFEVEIINKIIIEYVINNRLNMETFFKEENICNKIVNIYKLTKSSEIQYIENIFKYVTIHIINNKINNNKKVLEFVSIIMPIIDDININNNNNNNNINKKK